MYTVSFGEIFLQRFKNYPETDRKIIQDFIEHYEEHGFKGLPGRRKSSDDVDKDDRDFVRKVKYALDNKLYHYHIGIPEYDKTNARGDWTSEYIIHYQDISSYEIKILDYDRHPPFYLPKKEYLR